MTVVLRATGSMPASELTAKLGTAMTSHQAALRTARAQQAEQQASRTLREEQDSAYERSLAQDRERARQRREEEELRRKAETEALRKAEEADRQHKRQQHWRRWRAHQIKNEPATDNKDAIRVSIRMTDGQRIIRRFYSEDEIEEIYAFVECHDVINEAEITSESSDEKVPNEPEQSYTHEYAFRLVSPMPRTVYEAKDGGTIGKKIGKGANLIVEKIDEEEEEEDDDDGGGDEEGGRDRVGAPDLATRAV